MVRKVDDPFEFKEIHVDVGVGLELRIPLPTRLGSHSDITSLADAVGIEPPRYNIINLSIDEIIHVIEVLVTNGIIDNKIRKSKR